MSALSEGRLAEIARTQPNEWLPGPWFQREVEGVGGAPDCFEVHTADGTVLATLPDWAGNLALWMAEAPEVIAELLAEVARLRANAARAVAAIESSPEAFLMPPSQNVTAALALLREDGAK